MLSAAIRSERSADRASTTLAQHVAHRVHRGDVAAEARFVRHYSPMVRSLLSRLCDDPALAEDLHQETFQVVLVRLRRRRLADPARLPAFLRRTARNLWIAECRKAGRRQTYTGFDGLDRVTAPEQCPLGRALQRDAARRVRRLLADLRFDRDRQLLHRVYLAEDDRATICRDLGLSPRHFNRVLHRARGRLRDLLERAAKRDRLLPMA